MGLSGGYIHIEPDVPVLPSGTPASTWTSYVAYDQATILFARNVNAIMFNTTLNGTVKLPRLTRFNGVTLQDTAFAPLIESMTTSPGIVSSSAAVLSH
eukprot:695182-Pleurochrysis_carterae.AAC.1